MVRDITRGAVTGWLASLDLADTGLVKAVFSMIVDVACDEGMVTVNSVREAQAPKRTKPKKESYALSVEELEQARVRLPGVAAGGRGGRVRAGAPDRGTGWPLVGADRLPGRDDDR